MTGWNIYKKHWKFIIPLGIATVVAQFFIRLIQQSVLEDHVFLGFVLWILGILVSIIVTIGWAKVNLALVRTHTATWETFKSTNEEWMHFFKAAVWVFLYAIGYMILALIPVMIIGLIGILTAVSWLQLVALSAAVIIMVVVGIYLSIRYQFYPFIVLDNKELNGKAIAQKSAHLTRGAMLMLFGWALLSVLIAIIGLLFAGIGLVIALPIISLVQVIIYEHLHKHTHVELKAE